MNSRGSLPNEPSKYVHKSHQGDKQDRRTGTRRIAARPHDLVDLQLMCGHSQIDLAEARAICIRLFDYRRRQPWPPTVAKGSAWDSLYEDAGNGLDVLPTCDEAVAWANDLIESINKA